MLLVANNENQICLPLASRGVLEKHQWAYGTAMGLEKNQNILEDHRQEIREPSSNRNIWQEHY